jgi:hypothetical protein
LVDDGCARCRLDGEFGIRHIASDNLDAAWHRCSAGSVDHSDPQGAGDQLVHQSEPDRPGTENYVNVGQYKAIVASLEQQPP